MKFKLFGTSKDIDDLGKNNSSEELRAAYNNGAITAQEYETMKAQEEQGENSSFDDSDFKETEELKKDPSLYYSFLWKALK